MGDMIRCKNGLDRLGCRFEETGTPSDAGWGIVGVIGTRWGKRWGADQIQEWAGSGGFQVWGDRDPIRCGGM